MQKQNGARLFLWREPSSKLSLHAMRRQALSERALCGLHISAFRSHQDDELFTQVLLGILDNSTLK